MKFYYLTFWAPLTTVPVLGDPGCCCPVGYNQDVWRDYNNNLAILPYVLTAHTIYYVYKKDNRILLILIDNTIIEMIFNNTSQQYYHY